MTSVSFNLTTALLEGHEGEPDKIATGANAPGTGDVELRVNLANVKTRYQILRALDAFKRRLEDGRFGSDTGLI
jgi:hypothetical protein